MNILYLKALKAVNYEILNDETIERQLKNCFIDFWSSGQWDNLEEEDLEDITLDEMAKALLKVA